ncbi:hypothetical protein V6N11_049256 [Hibiscus sabdariffa]|uniref:Uncharacterized protein n=1 Tax=Hibiscus sabdariffa TaxID=183260 RepID=A0ABR2NZY2_9ROSI
MGKPRWYECQQFKQTTKRASTTRISEQYALTLLHGHSNAIKNQGNLLQTQGALLQSHSSSLRALENQVGQIAQALQVRPQVGLPSDTEVTKRNVKEQCSALT